MSYYIVIGWDNSVSIMIDEGKFMYDIIGFGVTDSRCFYLGVKDLKSIFKKVIDLS